MITVIIAGGSGTRLWPLSTHNKPKQLINLVDGVSTLRKAYDRAKRLGDDVYIVPESRLIDGVKTILPELDDDHIIVEPGLRGTASCYVLALDALSRRHSLDEPVAFVWADHHVRDADGFIDSFKVAADAAVRLKRLVTVGVEPTYPGPLGYIERGRQIDDEGVYDVISFKEKPDPAIATEYIRKGNYLWNTGYFIGTPAVFLDAMKSVASDLYAEYMTLHSIEATTSEEYREAYLGFSNSTIDVALSEKMDNLLVVPARFDWVDVGNFKDLHDVSTHDEKGNHIEGDNIYQIDIENAYVRNEESKPVVVIGLDNIVVVNTSDGIVVARRDVAVRVGEAAKQIQVS
jgi:mannose-1-phosphate guanylyltransferase/mannose-6-phosphate isomerase